MAYRLLDINHCYGEVVRVASTAALTMSAPGATIDGVTMVIGDRVLVKDQAAAIDNGIFVWFGAAVALVRDATAPLPQGATVKITSGTANGGTAWNLANSGIIVPGLTALTFTRPTDADSWADLKTYSGSIAAGVAAGTFLLSSTGAALTTTAVAIAVGTGILHLDPTTNYSIAGRTHQVRVVGTITNSGAAQTGNFTFGLYPITALGTTGIPTVGTVVGATSAIASPANGSITTVYGTVITMPAAGHYCVGIVTSAAIAASSVLGVHALLQGRET